MWNHEITRELFQYMFLAKLTETLVRFAFGRQEGNKFHTLRQILADSREQI